MPLLASAFGADQFFDPRVFGVYPTSVSSACWRGYQAVFTVFRTQLILTSFHASFYKKPKNSGSKYRSLRLPKINGVSPRRRVKDCSFNNNYSGLNYPINYTGGLLIGQGFIQRLHGLIAFHSAWKFKTVFELIFENGTLISETDRSRFMVDYRRQVLRESNDSTMERLDFAFSEIDQSYKF